MAEGTSERLFTAAGLLGAVMVVLGLAMTLQVLFGGEDWGGYASLPMYALIFVFSFNTVALIRRELVQIRVFAWFGVVVNLATVSLLVYVTGGVLSEYYLVFFVVPALAVIYLGSIGAIVGLPLTLATFGALSIISSPDSAVEPGLLAYRFVTLLLVSAPLVALVTYERSYRERLERSNMDLVQLNQQLKDSQASMVQEAKMGVLGRIAASLSHEMTQPLASIAINTRVLENGIAAGVTYENEVSIIKEQSDRMSALVREIGAFSNPSKSTIKPLDIAELVGDAVRLTSSQLDIAKTQVQSPAVGSTPWISGDTNQLLQVFVNLIVNAVDALEAVEVSRRVISVGSTLSTSENEVLISFSNNGPSIPPDQLEQIFEPFFSTKPGERGMGLGLWICSWIVEAHGGQISAFSEKNEGVTFTVELPVSKVPEVSPHRSELS